YSDLAGEVSEQEWHEALEKTKNNLAPGATGITYPLIKKAGPKAEKILHEFAIS
ncbi:16438_t:CDS:1, partial [Gigaspora rosea]